MKTCTACKVKKNISEFCRDSSKKDGLFIWCRTCSNKKRREWYQRNKDAQVLYQKRNRSEFPDKYKARYSVNNALATGKLLKEPCMICGSSLTEAHHPDYSKPLLVEWYCRQCHPV